MRAASDLEKRLFAEAVSLMEDKAALLEVCRNEGVAESNVPAAAGGTTGSVGETTEEEEGEDNDDDVALSQITHVPFTLASLASSRGNTDAIADDMESPPATPPDRRRTMLIWASPANTKSRQRPLAADKTGEEQRLSSKDGDSEPQEELLYLLPPDGDTGDDGDDDDEVEERDELPLHKRRGSGSSRAEESDGRRSTGCCAGRQRRRRAADEYQIRQVSPWIHGSKVSSVDGSTGFTEEAAGDTSEVGENTAAAVTVVGHVHV